MSSRLAGAALALTAAALLLLSLATSAWWDGHPEVQGRTIEAKTVHVGLHGSHGCNTGGDGGCTELEMPGAFTTTGYIVLAVAALLALAALLLAISTWRGAEGRKTLAKLVIGLTVVAVIAAIALIVEGPKVKAVQHVALPVGYGMYVFWVAAVAGIAGSVLAMRPIPQVVLRPSRAPIAPGFAPPPPASQPFDVLALLQEDTVRPAAMQAPSGPGGSLAGPAGPLAPMGPAPLFNSAPQLRALYEADPNHGGTSGYVPGAPAPLPMHAPTPIPRSQISAIAGIPTPAPFMAPEPPRPITTQGAAVGPGSAMPPPPPMRNKPPSLAPPPPNRARAQSVPPPPGTIAARLKASSVPPPLRGMPVPTTPRTLAAAVVPPPVATPPPVAAFKLPVRAVTDPSEALETMDRDAMTIDRGDVGAVQLGRPATGGEIGDSTDATISIHDADAEDTGVSAPLDTEEAPTARPPTETDDIETSAVEKHDPDDLAASDPGRPSESDLATTAREKISASEIATTDVAMTQATPEAPKIPITTAPDSLPPPTETQTATSGPSPACPQCESPMAWVEEHLRFYCKSCRMYF